jgi:hypothetical protein
MPPPFEAAESDCETPEPVPLSPAGDWALGEFPLPAVFRGDETAFSGDAAPEMTLTGAHASGWGAVSGQHCVPSSAVQPPAQSSAAAREGRRNGTAAAKAIRNRRMDLSPLLRAFQEV